MEKLNMRDVGRAALNGISNSIEAMRKTGLDDDEMGSVFDMIQSDANLAITTPQQAEIAAAAMSHANVPQADMLFLVAQSANGAQAEAPSGDMSFDDAVSFFQNWSLAAAAYDAEQHDHDGRSDQMKAYLHRLDMMTISSGPKDPNLPAAGRTDVEGQVENMTGIEIGSGSSFSMGRIENFAKANLIAEADRKELIESFESHSDRLDEVFDPDDKSADAAKSMMADFVEGSDPMKPGKGIFSETYSLESVSATGTLRNRIDMKDLDAKQRENIKNAEIFARNHETLERSADEIMDDYLLTMDQASRTGTDMSVCDDFIKEHINDPVMSQSAEDADRLDALMKTTSFVSDMKEQGYLPENEAVPLSSDYRKQMQENARQQTGYVDVTQKPAAFALPHGVQNMEPSFGTDRKFELPHGVQDMRPFFDTDGKEASGDGVINLGESSGKAGQASSKHDDFVKMAEGLQSRVAGDDTHEFGGTGLDLD